MAARSLMYEILEEGGEGEHVPEKGGWTRTDGQERISMTTTTTIAPENIRRVKWSFGEKERSLSLQRVREGGREEENCCVSNIPSRQPAIRGAKGT